MAREEERPGRLRRVHITPLPPPRPWVPWIVLIVALLSSALITWVVHAMIMTREELRFGTETDRIVRVVENRAALYETTLRGGAGFFSVERTIAFDEFRNFYRRQTTARTRKDLNTIGFARRFDRNAGDSLQRLLDSLYDDGVVITPEETTQQNRYVVTLLASQQDDPGIEVGQDIFSTPSYRDAINEAISSGRSRVVLLSDDRGQSDRLYLMVQPTWDVSENIEMAPERRSSSVRGVFFGTFNASDLLKNARKESLDHHVDYRVFEGPLDAGNCIYATSDDSTRGDALDLTDRSIVTSLDIAGERWTFIFDLQDDFAATADFGITPLILLLGILISFGLFLLTRSQVRAFEKLEASAKNLTEVESKLRRLNEELEDRVHSRTAELEASNNELKAFSYSVSHDLRAPLRGIDGFSKFLMEDYGEKLDETGLDYLRRIRDGAARMGDIIDNLLMLSRVTRWELQAEELDLSTIAEDIVERLRKETPEREVIVKVEPDIAVYADRRLVTVALENMFENAWKFTSRRKTAHITFSRESRPDPSSGRVVSAFVLADDGAGFESQYADKLFESFRRLHATSDFPGTGIGLATVKRVISRHGGTIWAEGEPGVGATFCFTLQTPTQ